MTNEEVIANLNMIRVAFIKSVTKEQEKLINNTFDMSIKIIYTLAEISSICDTAEMIIKEEYGVVIPEGYAEVFDLIKQKVEVRNND